MFGLYSSIDDSLSIKARITMSRVQLALNVNDLDTAVHFYSRLFATAPAKRRDGYANLAVANPPLKLVLFDSPARAARSTTWAWRSRARGW